MKRNNIKILKTLKKKITRDYICNRENTSGKKIIEKGEGKQIF